MKLYIGLWVLCLWSYVAARVHPRDLGVGNLLGPFNISSLVQAEKVTNGSRLCELRPAIIDLVDGLFPPKKNLNSTSFSNVVGTKSERAQPNQMPQATLMPRVIQEQPLAEPEPNDQTKFIEDVMEDATSIGIVPSEHQRQSWTIPLQINRKTVNTPIGLTGLWFPFGDKSMNYKMVGMSGCTAVFIVGDKGFWAGHFWEGSLTINGGSSFTYRAGPKPEDVTVRSLADFKKIAVEPLDQPAPAGADSFISLEDLKREYGDPFGASQTKADIYIITKSKGSTKTQQSQQRYPSQIKALGEAVQKIIGSNSISVRTYIGDKEAFNSKTDLSPAGVPLHLNGVSVLQYSPYAGKDSSGCPIARARILEELNPDPTIDRKWAASGDLAKRDGAACALQSPKPTATSTPPSCVLHNQDPDQGINQAFCLCDKSITLSPLPATHAQSESCAYKSIPGSTASARETVTTQTLTWTDNCAACTIVGGIADSETCTTVKGCTPTGLPSTTATAVPTIAAFLANLTSIDIGNADDGNGGKDLANEMYTKLLAMCGSNGCKADHAEMDNVEAAIADGEEPLKPAMYIQGAQYSSQRDLEQMLSVGISSWISALNNTDTKLCQEVEYEAEADMTGSGCGKGPITPNRIRRKRRRSDGHILWEREDVAEERRAAEKRCSKKRDCGGDGSGSLTCHYHARMCNAPNEISVVKTDGVNPYGQHLMIGLTLDTTDGGFNCEEFAEAITVAMAILAPELVEADALEGVELQAICGMLDNPQAAISSFLAAPSAKAVRVQGKAKHEALATGVTRSINLVSKTSMASKATRSSTSKP